MELQKGASPGNVLKIVLFILAAVNFSCILWCLFSIATGTFNISEVLATILLSINFALPVAIILRVQVRSKKWVLRTLLIIEMVVAAFVTVLSIVNVIECIKEYEMAESWLEYWKRYDPKSYKVGIRPYEKAVFRWSIRTLDWSLVIISGIVMMAGHLGKKFRRGLNVLAGVGTFLAIYVFFASLEALLETSQNISLDGEITPYGEIIFLSYVVSCLLLNVWLSIESREKAETEEYEDCALDGDAVITYQYIASGKGCAKCGQPLLNDAMFCGECGAKVIETVVCKGCGKERVGTEKFCTKCGTKFEDTAALSSSEDYNRIALERK